MGYTEKIIVKRFQLSCSKIMEQIKMLCFRVIVKSCVLYIVKKVIPIKCSDESSGMVE